MKSNQLITRFLLFLMAGSLAACGPIKVSIVLPADGSDTGTAQTATPVQAEDQDMTYLDFEQARDIAAAHAAWRAGIPAPEGSWTSQDTTPAGLVGASSFSYTLGPWVVEISAPVTVPAERVFTVTVDHMIETFRWEGSVDAAGRVSESTFITGTPAPQPGDPEETFASWVGVVVSAPPGSQFDDYFQMLDQEGTRCGIDSLDEAIRNQIEAFRDSGVLLRVYGHMEEGIDAYGMQLLVVRLEVYQP